MQTGIVGTLFLLAFSPTLMADPVERADAVFVLGSDGSRTNAFFSSATAYYSARLEREDLLVTTARSWAEVRELLVRSPQRGANPWGRVVIVAHGSQWTGLTVPVFPDGSPPRASELATLIDTQAFPPLPAGVLDADSQLLLETCGLGRRPDLLDLHARLLVGDDARGMKVSASTGLVEFSSVSKDGHVSSTERFEHAYKVEVHKSRHLDAQVADSGETVDPGGKHDITRSGWSRIPVHLAMSLDDERCQIRSAARLAHAGPVQTALHDHGLKSAQLHWTLEPTVLGGCRLIGRAEILTSRPSTITALRM